MHDVAMQKDRAAGLGDNVDRMKTVNLRKNGLLVAGVRILARHIARSHLAHRHATQQMRPWIDRQATVRRAELAQRDPPRGEAAIRRLNEEIVLVPSIAFGAWYTVVELTL